MIIEIKKHLIQEGIGEHFKNNWGKYAAGAAGAGAMYAAGHGYFGLIPQDAIQTLGAKTAGALENKAIGNDMQGLEDAAYETYSRPDNIIGPGDNKATFQYQNFIQGEHQLSNVQDAAASTIRKLTNISNSPDTVNFYIRHPLVSSQLQYEGAKQYLKPLFTTHDSD